MAFRLKAVTATLCTLSLFAVAPGAIADEPLHVRIDRMIEAQADGSLSPLSDDGEFLRRVYLDLAGRIPSSVEAREFFADADEEKRPKVIDRLLASEEYPRRMAQMFDVMLMERRGGHEEWKKFLENSFTANKPWDQIVREILTPDAEDEDTRGAALFYTKRLERYGQQASDMPGLIRDIGRLFLGVDVQCAQCHDHLFIDDYKQVDYQGLFAFVGQTFIRRDKQFPAVGENPLNKEIEFASVFEMVPTTTGPRLPFGESVAVPTFTRGEEYEVPPDEQKKTPGVLKFSPLRILGEQLPRADNRAFTHNIANRLWWVMMGRGIVHPLDLNHSSNPPTHPELLDMMADELAAHALDMKWFLRELALSEVYQRSSLLPDDAKGPEEISPDGYRVALERPLSAEQLLHSTLWASGEWERVTSTQETTENTDDESTEPTFDELTERFRGALANPPKEPEIEISPTIKAALFMSNDEVVLSWLTPRDRNLIDRLAKIEDAGVVAEELYLSVLSRLPSEVERVEVGEHLAKTGDRRADALGHLAWALLTSTEFCVNH